MAHQCHVTRCTWQRCRAGPVAKMNRRWSFKSCYVVPSWGLGKWKAAVLSTDSFYLVVVGAVYSSGCMTERIQLDLWKEDGNSPGWSSTGSFPAPWWQQLFATPFPETFSQHLKPPVTDITLLQMRLRAADEIEDHSTWLFLFGKAQTHSWSSALCCQLLSFLRAGNAGSWCRVCKPHLAPSYCKHSGLIV